MMPAAKHGDPQLGVDIHLCIVPPGVPAPLPTPHMSIVFDPMDYIPIFGATITVCGMKRAVAGTAGQVVHIPPGFPFAPKLPDKEDELFMGSATVEADGDPFSFLALPVLSCQAVGMPSPPRPKRKGGPRIMMLPTVFNLAIPTNVFIGGPPTISLMGMAFKLGFAALGKLAKAAKGVGKRFKDWRKVKFGHLNPGFLKCTILRAEPVNIVTGAVSVEHEDFTMPGLMPIRWIRQYTSDNLRLGACGTGWESPADARLEHDIESGVVLFRQPEGGIAIFERMPSAVDEAGAVLELMDGAVLQDKGAELVVSTKEDRTYRFPKSLANTATTAERVYPLAQVDDRCGNTLIYERDQGRLTEIREPGGRRLVIDWQHGLISRVSLQVPGSDMPHTFVEYNHDQSADLVEVRDALGSPYSFAYDNHHMLRHTDRNGLSFYYEYDRGGLAWRVQRAWGDGGLYSYQFAYLDAVNERRITDSLGNVSTVKLDDRGLPISEIDPLGGMTIYEYDDCGRTTAVVDPAGRRTEYHFDASGNLLELVRPDGSAVSTKFERNKAIAITDPAGGSWNQRWDDRGLLVAQSDPLGKVSRFEYDRQGRLTAHINPRSARTTLQQDNFANLTELTDALGHTTRFTHDALGNTVIRDDALGRSTRYAYDSKGRLIGVTMPSGSKVSCAFDSEDNLIRYTDENGGLTQLEYFGQGEVARRIQPDGHTVTYLYDTEERLTGVRNQRGEMYRLNRDALGRVIEEVDYWGQARRYDYDGGGYLTASTDPLGRRIEYACDPLGRIIKKLMPCPQGMPEPCAETFAYDANGNLTETANAHVAVFRSFDALGQLVAEEQALTTGENFVIKNAYDEAGNRIRRTTNSAGAGHSCAFAYDLLDQCNEVIIDDGAPMRMRHDAVGQLTSERMGSQLERELSYTVDGLLAGQRVSAKGKALFAVGYDYDPTGNLIRRTDSAFGTESFLYDPMGRVLEHLDPQGKLEKFLNDPAGDRLITQVRGAGAVAEGDGTDSWRREGRHEDTEFHFDRAGNLVLKDGPEFRLNLCWDANQRMIVSVRTDNDGTQAETTYAYDPLGRRLYKETAGKRTWFGWDGDAMTLDVVEDVPREFVYRPETFEPLAMLASERLVYVNDPNGAPTRLVDAQGLVQWSARYAVWGGIAALGAEEVDNPLRLQGQYADGETGFRYNRYRYSDVLIGEFVAQDPIGLSGGTSPYQFAPNTLCWIDPLGLKCKVSFSAWVRSKVGQGTHVYIGYVKGKAVYVGIAKDVQARALQHGDRFDKIVQISKNPLNRGHARAIEQAIIDKNKKFLNDIDSISNKRPLYKDAVKWGKDWLERNPFSMRI